MTPRFSPYHKNQICPDKNPNRPLYKKLNFMPSIMKRKPKHYPINNQELIPRMGLILSRGCGNLRLESVHVQPGMG